MYNHKCMHRDLKPQNILLHNGQIKVADFGFAKIVEDMNRSEAQTLLGTPLYIPMFILIFIDFIFVKKRNFEIITIFSEM